MFCSQTVKVLIFVVSGIVYVSAKYGFGPGKQDYGHITVREGSHMFFWLFWTTAKVPKYTDRPLIIWLQGGPASSSTAYGNFDEIGPLDTNLKKRNNSWVHEMNVVFIDNPVGTGFSYVDDLKYLTENNTIIAQDLTIFMKKFYELFPSLKSVPTHIFGESYGGKMAVEFALELNKAIERKEIECNLKTVALGDPFIDPRKYANNYPNVLQAWGIIDAKGHDEITKIVQKIDEEYEKGEFYSATMQYIETQWKILQLSFGIEFYNIIQKTTDTNYRTNPLVVNVNPEPVGYKNALRSIFNSFKDSFSKYFSEYQYPDDIEKYFARLMRGRVRKALRISEEHQWCSQCSDTFQKIAPDFMISVNHIVEELLNTTNINVVLYSGQLDFICPTIAQEQWINELNWIGKNSFEEAPRKPIFVNHILEGYKKNYGKLTMYWVNRAGHMVPTDNPAAMDYILREEIKYHEN